jgi:hypothetical protein
MARKDESLLEKYTTVASRRGLVLLDHWNTKNRRRSQRCKDMCVYDPVSGARTFLSPPPDIPRNKELGHVYVLLTAADGIGCPFLLLVADFYGRSIRVQIASPCGTWGPLTHVEDSEFWWTFVRRYCDPAVLRGGVVHWLAWSVILSYDVGTGKTGSVKLPPATSRAGQLHLATSSDGELLKLLRIEGYMMSVWIQLPVSAGAGWELKAMIDMEEKLRLIVTNFPPGNPDVHIEFEGTGKRTGDVVLLRIHRAGLFYIIVFDLETKDMHRAKGDGQLLEIDLPSRIENMKTFS